MSETKGIIIDDLHEGDVILFSPAEGDALSEAIAWVTESTVTHSAMVYYSNDQIAEESLHGLILTPTQTRVESERTATVLRLQSDSQEIDMKKVVDIAAKYVTSDQPYATADLIFIAVYFLFKKCSQDTRINAAIAKIIKLAMMSLIDIANEKLYPGKVPMHCSQFVYHCYKEAGPEYEIILKKEVQAVKKYNLLQLVKEQNPDRNLSYKRVKKNLKKKAHQKGKDLKLNATDNSVVVKKAIEELLAAVGADKSEPVTTTIKLDKEFMNLVHKFLILLTRTNSLKEAIEKISELEEFFVTPGDLLCRTENLIEIGVLKSS